MAWDEYFLKGLMSGAELASNRSKQQQLMADFILKQKGEDRRQKYSDALMENIGYKNKVLKNFFGGGEPGADGVPSNGVNSNFPPGSTFSLGGVTIPLNRKYSETESKSLSGAGALLKDLSELKGMFEKGSATGGAQLTGGASMGLSNLPLIGAPLSAAVMGFGGILKGGENRQNYSDLLRNVANRLLYLRSGAQINEQEYKRFVAQLPALMRNDKLDKKQLNRFIEEFSALRGRIESGAQWDSKQKSFIGGKEPENKTINLDSLFEGLALKEEE